MSGLRNLVLFVAATTLLGSGCGGTGTGQDGGVPPGVDGSAVGSCAVNNGGCGSAVFYACTGHPGAGPTCSDIDECATDNGGCGSASFYSCTNNAGAVPTCADIDECLVNNGGCGSSAFYSCSNNTGAVPTCADIDECAVDNGGCGSASFYSCTNNTGAVPTCADIDECAVNNGGCGSASFYSCTNNTGAVPTCADINECLVNNGGCGSASFYTCSNNIGATRTCQDIDECATNRGGCDPHATCTNSQGSWSCDCQPGWSGDGFSCACAPGSLYFNGTSAMATFANSEALNLENTDSTVEAWVRPTEASSWIRFFWAKKQSGENLGWQATWKPTRKVDATAVATADNALALHVWAHLAVTYSSATGQKCIWINGAQQACAVSAPTEGANIRNVTLGNEVAGILDTYWAGYIDEFRISNTVRYSSSFTPSKRFQADASTLGLWHFDEGSGTITAGSVGNMSGTLTNTAWAMDVGCEVPVVPPPGQKMCLDGTSGRGDTGAVDSLSNLTSATVELWFKSTDPASPPTAERNLVYFHPAAYVASNYPVLGMALADASAQNMPSLSGRVLTVGVDGRGGPQGQLNVRGFDIDATLPWFDEKKWHHYAVVFSGAAQRAFVDGNELTSAVQRDGSGATSFASAFGPGFQGTYGSLYLALGVFARDSIRYANGAVSGVRVSNIARYSGAFLPVSTLANDVNTLLLVPASEGSGATSLDQSSSGFNVTWSGGYAWCSP